MFHLINIVNNKSLTDQQIVQGILSNDNRIIQYFFFEKCSSLLNYIVSSVFDGKVDRDELVSELFLYISSNNWYKLRQFDYRSKLITWTSVVAIRFFIKKRSLLLENCEYFPQYVTEENTCVPTIDDKIDLYSAIAKMPNQRYANVIRRLELNEEDPKTVASDMGVTLENLYNIRRRARVQLRTMFDYNGNSK